MLAAFMESPAEMAEEASVANVSFNQQGKLLLAFWGKVGELWSHPAVTSEC